MAKRKQKQKRSRRGVLLLVVLSLLVMFVLAGMTFMLVAGVYRKSASEYATVERAGDPPRNLLDGAMYQVLRGTSNARSVVGGHDLLDDTYGVDGFVGLVRNIGIGPPPNENGLDPNSNEFRAIQENLNYEFYPLDIKIDHHLSIDGPFGIADYIAPDFRVPIMRRRGYFNGCVLTMLSGDLAGTSMRIVTFEPEFDNNPNSLPIPTWARVMVATPPGASGVIRPNDRFVVNGKPYSGMGHGFDYASPNPTTLLEIDSLGQELPIALFPNRYGLRRLVDESGGTIRISSEYILAGERYIPHLDESWDAPDLQNMLLAAVSVDGSKPLLPSLHRPELVNFWFSTFRQPGWPLANLDLEDAVLAFERPYGDDFLPSWKHNNLPQDEALAPPVAELLVALRRAIILRPLREDNPEFTGSNPNFHSILSGLDLDVDGDGLTDSLGFTWDVDNDGDGIPESCWMDFGFSTMRTADGHVVKPLVAVLCQDLDGHINLNTADRIAAGTFNSAEAEDFGDVGAIAGWPILGVSNLPHGVGYGPAEIVPPTRPPAAFFLPAERVSLLQTRYGGRFDTNGDGYPETFEGGPGIFDSVNFGSFGLLEDDQFLQSAWKTAGIPHDFSDLNYFSAFSSPSDVHGRGVIGLSHAGQPLMSAGVRDALIFDGAPQWLGQPTLVEDPATSIRYKHSDSINDPYEINLLDENATDSRFTEVELERVLRAFDADAYTLSPRLLNAAPSAFATAANLPTTRHLVTVRSFEIPALPAVVPQTIGLGHLTSTLAGRPIRNIVDLFEARLISNDPKDGGAFVGTIDQLEVHLNAMLPFELRRGHKMDLNRPFGDGIDNNGNFVVDEPGEFLELPNLRDDNSDGTIDQPRSVDSNGNGIIDENEAFGEDWLSPMNLINDDPVFVQEYRGFLSTTPTFEQRAVWFRRLAPARQIYARHLYCLMMFLKPASVKFNLDPAIDDDVETARIIAQWAINVVDFRDPDSIRTPFEYDENPYDGWHVDGDISLPREPTGQVVWGVERPELLITETLAFHDRRTEDRGDESVTPVSDENSDGNGEKVGEGDNDFDQRLVPQSGVFVELYNPGLQGNREDVTTRAVALNQFSDAASGSPVWRLVFGAGTNVENDPDDELQSVPFKLTSEDRIVYFLDPTIAPIRPVDAAEDFYPDGSIVTNMRPIPPGHFSVVGSSGVKDTTTNEYITKIGRFTLENENEAFDRTQSRCIILKPFLLPPNRHQIEVLNNATSIDVPVEGEFQPAGAIPIEWPRSLSITDPTGGYPPALGTALMNFDQVYNPVKDVPLDIDTVLKTDGTKLNFRTVYLQRLADPTRPWNIVDNPYLTVDSMPVDLTRFNGVTKETDLTITDGGTKFATRQRGDYELVEVDAGGNVTKVISQSLRSLWSRRPENASIEVTSDSTQKDPNQVFEFDLVGRFPIKVADRSIITDPNNLPVPLPDTSAKLVQSPHTLGYMNAAHQPAFTDVSNPLYRGLPDTDDDLIASKSGRNVFDQVNPQAFPWLNWNNRPFVSPQELLLVPRSSSSRLFIDFTLLAMSESNTTLEDKPFAAFGHLLNFFSADPANSGNFYRLLDFVDVRSPYLGTEQWLEPGYSRVDNDLNDVMTKFGFDKNSDGLSNVSDFVAGIRPPFHYLSQYRNPGKINLNTIPHFGVWSGMNEDFPAWNNLAKWNQMNDSRRGFSIVNQDNYPTLFSNPFRSAMSAALMPNVADLQKTKAIEATLLRPGSAGPLLGHESFLPYNNTYRNPFFRYQGLQRLGNLVTNQSNVYAIWLTVGYFEVNPETGQLGQEMGTETGDIKRNRAFYIIDRSIPVAFEPGQNHNVDRCVVLRRMIE